MAAPQSTAPRKGGGNLLTQRLGPLATWVWLLIGTVLIVIIYVIMKKKGGTKAGTPGQPCTTASGQAGTYDANGVCQVTSTTGTAQVPDIILQNYNQAAPGAAAAAPPVVPPSQPAPAPPAAPGAPAAAKVTVPAVSGQRANFAIGNLESLGLSWKSTTGDRNPKHEYNVSSQSPAAGTKVARGTMVSLGFKQIK